MKKKQLLKRGLAVAMAVVTAISYTPTGGLANVFAAGECITAIKFTDASNGKVKKGQSDLSLTASATVTSGTFSGVDAALGTIVWSSDQAGTVIENITSGTSATKTIAGKAPGTALITAKIPAGTSENGSYDQDITTSGYIHVYDEYTVSFVLDNGDVTGASVAGEAAFKKAVDDGKNIAGGAEVGLSQGAIYTLPTNKSTGFTPANNKYLKAWKVTEGNANVSKTSGGSEISNSEELTPGSTIVAKGNFTLTAIWGNITKVSTFVSLDAETASEGTVLNAIPKVTTGAAGTDIASIVKKYEYQWKNNGAAINGATSQRYTVASTDIGKPITCVVTATLNDDVIEYTWNTNGEATSDDVTPKYTYSSYLPISETKVETKDNVSTIASALNDKIKLVGEEGKSKNGVDFDTNSASIAWAYEGTGDVSSVKGTEASQGSKTLPAGTYTFTGETATGTVNGWSFAQGIEKITFEATVVVEAQILEVTYSTELIESAVSDTVTGVPDETVEISEGSSLSLPVTVPTATGYEFAGWKVKTAIPKSQFDGAQTLFDGTPVDDRVSLKENDILAPGTKIIVKDALELKAQWTKKTYTIVFDVNGATGGVTEDKTVGSLDVTASKSDKALDNEAMFDSTEPTISGKKFVGWALQEDATKYVYKTTDTAQKVIIDNADKASIKLYAVYVDVLSDQYTIKSINVNVADEAGKLVNMTEKYGTTVSETKSNLAKNAVVTITVTTGGENRIMTIDEGYFGVSWNSQEVDGENGEKLHSSNVTVTKTDAMTQNFVGTNTKYVVVHVEAKPVVTNASLQAIDPFANTATESDVITAIKNAYADGNKVTLGYSSDFSYDDVTIATNGWNGNTSSISGWVATPDDQKTYTIYAALDGTDADKLDFSGVSTDGSAKASIDVTVLGKTSYTVKFSGANAEAQTIVGGAVATEPTPAPTKTGYEFAGWYLGSEKYDFSTPVTANITLTAKWDAKTYKVTFDATSNGGKLADGQATSKTVTYDGTYGTLPTVATRDNLTFAGWYTEKSAGTKVEATTKVAITAAQTLYAQWTTSSPGSGTTGGSSGGGSSSNVTTKTETSTDAAGNKTTTTTATNKTTGQVTETATTQNTDGSKEVVKTVTNKDGSGSITDTETSAAGAVTEAVATVGTDGAVDTITVTATNASKTSTTNTEYTATSTKAVTLKDVETTKTSVTVPATVKVGNKSFKVTAIAKNALSGNKKITKVTIGKNVKKIGANAFKGDKKLKTVEIKGAVKTVGKNAFKGINKKATITIKASKTNYKKAVKAIQSSGVAKTVTFKRAK